MWSISLSLQKTVQRVHRLICSPLNKEKFAIFWIKIFTEFKQPYLCIKLLEEIILIPLYLWKGETALLTDCKCWEELLLEVNNPGNSYKKPVAEKSSDGM